MPFRWQVCYLEYSAATCRGAPNAVLLLLLASALACPAEFEERLSSTPLGDICSSALLIAAASDGSLQQAPDQFDGKFI